MAFVDPTPAHLRKLHPQLAATAIILINALRDIGVPAYISSSTRTPQQQSSLVAAGRSRTLNSKHLSGRAFDFDVLGWSRDALPKWWLAQVGAFGESLGLIWGGNFKNFYDGGHFELP